MKAKMKLYVALGGTRLWIRLHCLYWGWTLPYSLTSPTEMKTRDTDSQQTCYDQRNVTPFFLLENRLIPILIFCFSCWFKLHMKQHENAAYETTWKCTLFMILVVHLGPDSPHLHLQKIIYLHETCRLEQSGVSFPFFTFRKKTNKSFTKKVPFPLEFLS